MAERMSSSPSAAPSAATERPLRDLWWIPVAHGAVVVVIGLLLLVVPGRTLVFAATLVGISLVIAALFNVVTALGHGHAGRERVSGLGIALLAGVAGIVVIARPEGSIRTIAVVTGVYLLVMGVTVLVLGSPWAEGGHARLGGGLALLAGVVLLVWPDETVGIVATIYGVFMVTLGIAEMLFGLRARRAGDAA
jgi:uncharacterized membrane protein HdeD (DUF308 family)